MVNKSTKSCSFCGNAVSDDDAFCNSCGASLTEKVEPTAEIPVVARQPSSVDHPQYSQSVVTDYPRRKGNVVAIVSMVLGILAVGFSLVWFLCCVSIPFSIAALITGIIGSIRRERRFFGVAGIGLAVVAAILYTLQLTGVFYLY